MAVQPFNESKDKITERELVYDIIERLKLGKTLTDDAVRVLHRPGEMLTGVLSRLANMVPVSVLLNYYKIKTGFITIAANAKGGSTIIEGLTDRKVVLAVSQQSGINVTKCLSVINYGNNGITVTMSSSVPYTNSDYIKIYAT